MVSGQNPKIVGKPIPAGTGQQITTEFDDGGSWVFNAVWKLRRVGRAECSFETNRLKISDPLVENAVHLSWRVSDVVRCLLRISCPRGNFRGHDIGSKIMDAVILQTKRAGVSEIWGSVNAGDIDATEHLLAFYESRGFTIRAPDGECLGKATQKIVMNLVSDDSRGV